jgi:hypothetical protein
MSGGWIRSCTSEGCGTGFEGLNGLHITCFLRNIVPSFFHVLVSLSEETKDMGSLDTPLVVEFPVNGTRYSSVADRKC